MKITNSEDINSEDINSDLLLLLLLFVYRFV